MEYEVAPRTWATYLLGIIAAFISAMAIDMARSGTKNWQTMLFVSVLILWATFALANMRFEFHDDRLIARFWPFYTIVPYEDVIEVSTGTVPILVGPGLHYGLGSAFYTTRWGSCVIVERRSGKRLVLTTRDDEGFARRLKQVLKQVLKTKKPRRRGR